MQSLASVYRYIIEEVALYSSYFQPGGCYPAVRCIYPRYYSNWNCTSKHRRTTLKYYVFGCTDWYGRNTSMSNKYNGDKIKHTKYDTNHMHVRNIGNRLFYSLLRHKKTQQKSKIIFPQFLRYMYVCVCVCMLALYRSHRLTHGAENFTMISVNTHHDAQTIIL